MFLNSTTPFDQTSRLLEKNHACKELQETIGKVEIVFAACDSGASCDFQNSRITLDPSVLKDVKIGGGYPRLMGRLVFEMSNLAQRQEFFKILGNSKEISPETFVEECERIEHRSALKTKSILREIFPKDTWRSLPFAYVSSRFPIYYLQQQLGGHSKEIADRYAHLFSTHSKYQGNLKGTLEQKEANYLSQYLSLRSGTEDSDPTIAEKAKEDLKDLIEFIELSRKIEPRDEVFDRVQKRILELESLFNN